MLPLVSFLRSRSPVFGVPGLCWMRLVPFAPPPTPKRPVAPRDAGIVRTNRV